MISCKWLKALIMQWIPKLISAKKSKNDLKLILRDWEQISHSLSVYEEKPDSNVDIWDNNIFLSSSINIGWQSWQNYCLFKCNNICQSVTGFIASDLEKEICSTVNPHSPVRQGHVNCVFRGRVLPAVYECLWSSRKKWTEYFLISWDFLFKSIKN